MSLKVIATPAAREPGPFFTSVLLPKDASTTYLFMIIRSSFGVGPYGSDECSTAPFTRMRSYGPAYI